MTKTGRSQGKRGPICGSVAHHLPRSLLCLYMVSLIFGQGDVKERTLHPINFRFVLSHHIGRIGLDVSTFQRHETPGNLDPTYVIVGYQRQEEESNGGTERRIDQKGCFFVVTNHPENFHNIPGYSEAYDFTIISYQFIC